ncbi:MAG: hypothetical protein OEW46_09950 [Actinomycetota bacterium]|nr:hypothetical protein [Actinomycetota bacterium]
MRAIRSLVVAVVAVGLALASTGGSLSSHPTTKPYEWRRPIGLSLADVAIAGSGLSVVTGEIEVDDEHRGFLIAAFDSAGTPLWQDTWLPLGKEPSGTSGEAVTIGPNGDIYSVGFGWHCRFGCESGGWFIRAYSPDGVLRWTRQAARWRTGPRQSKGVGIDAWPGGVAIAGFEYDDDVGPTSSWIRTYGLDGTSAWKTRIGVAAAVDLRVSVADIATAGHGAVFVAGDVGVPSPKTGWTHEREPFVAAFGPDGERRWTRIFREPGDRDDDAAVSIDGRNGILAVGGTLGAPIGYGIDAPHLGWLARLSFDGRLRWMRSWGASRPQSVEAVALAPDGMVMTVGGVADRGYALIARTYDRRDLIGALVIDPNEGSLVGSSIAIDGGGVSLVGTRYRNAYLWPGVGGRLWRLDAPVVRRASPASSAPS